MRVVLLGASFETGNLGVSALCLGSIKAVLQSYPDARIAIVDYSKRPSARTITVAGQSVHVPLVNIRFSKLLWLPNNIAFLIVLAVIGRLVPNKRRRQALFHRNRTLRAIVEADCVAAISGGDSFSDVYGFRRLLYVSLPQILALLLRKHFILLPQTIGPFKSKPAKLLAACILSRAAKIYSRDLQGQEIVASVCGRQQHAAVRFCYDVAFIVDAVTPAEKEIVGLDAKRARTRIGVNVSGLLYMGGYTKANMFDLKEPYHQLVENLIHEFLKNAGSEVLLVPHVFASAAGSESDTTACDTVYNRLKRTYPGRIGTIQAGYDQSEIKGIIATCDFFIGSRMHACIGAISQAIPTVAIAYSGKFNGVMQTLGVGDIVVDARQSSSQEILARVMQVYRTRDKLHQELATRMKEVRKAVLGLFSSTADSDPPLYFESAGRCTAAS